RRRRSRLSYGAREQLADLGAAVEALAAAHQHACAAAQPVEVGRRDRSRESLEDLAAGHPLAEADNSAEVGVGGDSVLLRIRSLKVSADVRHPHIRQLAFRPKRQTGPAE